MRTLQEKYNAIQEGKFSKDHFLAEARMQQPQLVTRFNGYDDAVQILKNRGMIQEARVEEVTPAQEKYRVKPPTQFKQDIAAAKKMIDAGKSEKEVVAKYGQAAFNAVNAQNLGEARLTKNNLTDYRYKPTNEMDKYPYEQILRGLRVELETMGVQGTPTADEYAKALAKVSKNLAKDSIFYTNQVAGVNPKVDLHDKMVPVTAKNSVDTFNGMKKAELKEGFKKLIKKVLSEEVIDVESYKEDVYEMYGEDDMDESAMGDIYQIAQEHDTFEHFVQAVEDEFGPVEDIAELEHIFNSTRGEDDIDYGDENFSDPFIDGDLDEEFTMDKFKKGLKNFGRTAKQVGSALIGEPTYDHIDDKTGEWKKDKAGKDYDMYSYADVQGADLDPEEGLNEVRKAKSLSELLK